MKKIVYFLLFALCLPLGLRAQSVDDDLYFVPSKDKQEKKEAPIKKEQKKQVTTNIYTSPGTTVVIQDRKGKTRDVDEYNRRYDAANNEFVMDNDTLYIKEKSKPDLEGEWVTGEFNGTQDDYEYAERIIRFRNPRFAISISSPLYWDVVYGPNSWDWNVYTDGMYAYAFPTFSNPYWWDWRYGSYGWGSNYGWGWNRPYYSWGYSPGYWGGWNGGYWGGWYGGGYWGHHHHWHGSGWGGGGYNNMMYTDRRSPRYNDRSNNGRYTSGRYQSSRTSDRYQSSRTSDRTLPGRVVGTRDNTREKSSIGNRVDNSYRKDNYTRPSSTRSNTRNGSTYERSSSTRASSGRSENSYNRGSSSRTYERSSGSSSRESYSPSSSRSSSSYSPSSSSSRGGGYSSGGSGGSSRGSSSSGGGSARGGSRR